MPVATICITDLDEHGRINFEVDFGDDGVQEGSAAQYVAVKFMRWFHEQETGQTLDFADLEVDAESVEAMQTHNSDC